jgi:hypothetical protein
MKTGAAMQQPSNQFGSIIAVTKQESTDKKWSQCVINNANNMRQRITSPKRP